MKTLDKLQKQIDELNALLQDEYYFLDYYAKNNGEQYRGYYLVYRSDDERPPAPKSKMWKRYLHGDYLGSNSAEVSFYLAGLIRATSFRKRGFSATNCNHCAYPFRLYRRNFYGATWYELCPQCGDDMYLLYAWEIHYHPLPDVRFCVRCKRDLSNTHPNDIRVTKVSRYSDTRYPEIELHCADCYPIYLDEIEARINSKDTGEA